MGNVPVHDIRVGLGTGAKGVLRMTSQTRGRGGRQEKPIERRILFYRADIGADPAGVPLFWNPQDVVRAIEGLPFDTGARYLDDREGNSLCCWTTSGSANPRIILGKIRRSDIPPMESDGRFTPLSLPERGGLAELTHLVLFPENVVGAEFNFHGPKASRLADYLRRKLASLYPTIELHLLVRGDIVAQLEKLKRVKLFRLKVRPSYIDQIAKADESLAESFRHARDATGAQDIEMVLKPEPRSRGALGERALTTIRRLAGLDDLQDNASRFYVEGYVDESRIEQFDVLKDGLVAVKKIERLRAGTKQLSPDAAFSAIEEAHGEVLPNIKSAAGVVMQLEQGGGGDVSHEARARFVDGQARVRAVERILR